MASTPITSSSDNLGGEKSTPMDHDAADRISAAAERDPNSDTARSGFDDRAQDAANRNDSGAR